MGPGKLGLIIAVGVFGGIMGGYSLYPLSSYFLGIFSTAVALFIVEY